MYDNQTITLVIPCYNEEKGVAEVIKATPDIVDEILVVDNNSSDATAEVAESLGARVVSEKRIGYGRAYKTGFKAAKGDIVVTVDGDGTYPVIAIPYLVALLKQENLDFISVWRVHLYVGLSLENFLRKYGNVGLNIILTVLFGIRMKDSQSGMWVFKKGVLEALNLTSDGMAFSEEIKIEAFKNRTILSREVPLQFSFRHRVGESKLNLWEDGFRNILFLFQKRFHLQ
ncbi:MAG: glycosyltransferase family 2 protein [Acidobacteria bacterium]|nr:glycosyltransferase family 2 protein [Acidobacteriota bacterium]